VGIVQLHFDDLAGQRIHNPRQDSGNFRLEAGNWDLATRLQKRLSPPAAAVTTQFGIPGLKAAMEFVGLTGGYPRLPLLPATPPQVAELREIFRSAGVGETASKCRPMDAQK